MGEISEQLVLKTFEKYFKNYRKVDPDDNLDRILERQLPKICINDTSKSILAKVNEILSAEISVNKSLNIEDLHTLTYCAARTVTELCGQFSVVYEQSKIPTKFPEDEISQKKLFQNSPQKFRRLLFDDSADQEARPSEDDIHTFWSDLWEEESHYIDSEDSPYIDEETKRIKKETKRIENETEKKKNEIITNSEISMKDLKKALKKKKNWSPPGIDGVQTFWYKKFKSVKKALLGKINAVIKGDEEMPEFFTVGFTELQSKGGNPENASNYRPITHLPAIYKIITRCVYQKIFQHYQDYNILADEQCGGRKDCYGVRKALIIDSVALNQEEVHGYYVDFKKAFDSVPHDWILKMLEIYGVDKKLVRFLKIAMGKWKTRICLKPDILTKTIKLNRGVFQGDSTSVILFWTAMNPLSFALRNTNVGLNLQQGGILSHVLYMDDLKLYASKDEDLKRNYHEVENFTKSINMTINKSKLRKFSVSHSPKTNPESSVYLGYIQKPKIQHNDVIYHKVRKLERKSKKIATETKISEEDKTFFKMKFVVNSIFNTFGIIHWKSFKRELLETEVRKKFLPIVQDVQQNKNLPQIYLKLINDMCKMRERFFAERRKSVLIENIVKNDTVTPLRLSLEDEKEYVNMVVGQINNKRRKRKITEEQ